MNRSSTARAVAVAGLVTLTSACLSSGGTDSGPADQSGGEGKKTIQILGNFSGEEATAFEAALQEFPDKDIQVVYTGSQDFATLVRSRVQANNVPDIGLFPQPGLLADIAKTGKLLDVSEVVDLDTVKDNIIPGFIDAAEVDGTTYGVPMRMAVKSIVWTPKPEFEQAGYKAPETLDELFALADAIKAKGQTPWCIGMESGAATGWLATDYMEDLVLRLAGPETYDKWVSHEIPFNAPEIKEAGQAFERIFAPEGNVLGGRKAISSTSFQTALNPMFASPAKCFMSKQGNFIQSPGFFPDAVQQDIDNNAAVFAFPGTEAGKPAPALLGGDLAAAFNNDPSTKKVMEFLASEDFGGPWAKAGGWISPYKGFDASNYPNDTTREIAENALAAEVGRYDGSDAMPAAVGAGSFWKGMTAWVSGQKTLDQVLDEIEKSWPTS